MVGLVIRKRAIPIYWQFLEKRGASNLAEQQAILRPVLKLLKSYKIVVLGDREFHSAELASCLIEKNVGFVFRQKKTTNLQIEGQDFQSLDELNIKQGTRLFVANIKVNKKRTKTGLSMGIYWKRKYRGMGELEPWYLLTNLPDLPETIKAYKKRVGIEAMFKDCKTGGYNLAGAKEAYGTSYSACLIDSDCLCPFYFKRTINSSKKSNRIHRTHEKNQAESH